METPLLLIIFNRPEKTKRVFEEIRKARPTMLFIAADGPRSSHPEDKERCRESRSLVQHIDWPCEVQRNYSEKNLGCDVRVPSAISWLFEHANEGIIFEDDCLPSPDFFPFCQELLQKYRNASEVKMISGNNFQDGIQRGEASFYFSRYANTWGWATWKRAWGEFQNDLDDWEGFKAERKIEKILPSRKQQRYWLNFFQKIKDGKYDFWDAKWTFSIWNRNGICISPNKNLVINIGHDFEGTHTTSPTKGTFMKREDMSFPLTYPSEMKVDAEADDWQFASIYKTSIIRSIINKIKHVF